MELNELLKKMPLWYQLYRGSNGWAVLNASEEVVGTGTSPLNALKCAELYNWQAPTDGINKNKGATE